MEKWKSLAINDAYEISSTGTLRSAKTKRVLKTESIKGYSSKVIRVNGKRKRYRIHRLVAESFIPGFKEHLHIDHINRVRHDNRVENLRCVSPSVNRSNRDIGIVTIDKIIELSKQGYSSIEIKNALF